MSSPGLGYIRSPQLTHETASGAVAQPASARVLGTTYATVYVIGTGTTSTGVVTIETADIDPAQEAAGYAGTWSVFTTVNASDVTGGQQKAIALGAGPWSYIRTRITTAIGGGGDVSTVLVAV